MQVIAACTTDNQNSMWDDDVMCSAACAMWHIIAILDGYAMQYVA